MVAKPSFTSLDKDCSTKRKSKIRIHYANNARPEDLVEDHFRRALGSTKWTQIFMESGRGSVEEHFARSLSRAQLTHHHHRCPSVECSVDEHFRRALGPMWQKL